MRKNTRRERRFTTYRLLSDDYELMRDLGKNKPGFKDRYQALLALVPIVESLEMLPKKYRGFRVGIPVALDQAIRVAAERTGYDFVDIMLIAARIYAGQDKRSSHSGNNGQVTGQGSRQGQHDTMCDSH
jgi:hypothetical protein